MQERHNCASLRRMHALLELVLTQGEIHHVAVFFKQVLHFKDFKYDEVKLAELLKI